MNYQLCWVNNGGETRELELWDGVRKICGFKDIKDMGALEAALNVCHESRELINRAAALDAEVDELKERVEGADDLESEEEELKTKLIDISQKINELRDYYQSDDGGENAEEILDLCNKIEEIARYY